MPQPAVCKSFFTTALYNSNVQPSKKDRCGLSPETASLLLLALANLDRHTLESSCRALPSSTPNQTDSILSPTHTSVSQPEIHKIKRKFFTALQSFLCLLLNSTKKKGQREINQYNLMTKVKTITTQCLIYKKGVEDICNFRACMVKLSVPNDPQNKHLHNSSSLPNDSTTCQFHRCPKTFLLVWFFWYQGIELKTWCLPGSCLCR